MNTVNTETSLDETRWGLDVVVTVDGEKPVHAAGLVYDINTGEGFISLGQKVIQFETNFIRDLDNHFNLVRGYVLGKYGVDLPKSTIDPEHSLGVLDCYTPAGERQRSRIALIDTTDIIEPETKTGKIVFSLDHDLNNSFLSDAESSMIKDGQNIAVGGTISINLCLDYISMASSDDEIRNIVGSTAIGELTRAIRALVIGSDLTQDSNSDDLSTFDIPDEGMFDDVGDDEGEDEDEYSFMDPLDRDSDEDEEEWLDEEDEDEEMAEDDDDSEHVMLYKN